MNITINDTTYSVESEAQLRMLLDALEHERRYTLALFVNDAHVHVHNDDRNAACALAAAIYAAR